MAAKQGLSAQISQASEDAKRGFLQRTHLTNSLWFSNLNTTCTIKSAPPRTPDVLGMLANKSGWLFKRNEQHVWQARYCCVVPHTFLYYFDQHPTIPCQTPQLTSKQQEVLNKIVKQGFGKRGQKQSQPRSSIYNVLGAGAGGGNALNDSTEIPNDEAGPAPSSTQPSTVTPAGIIDMECYTTIHRNNENELVMELAGDETVNPDLRSFYFCANTDQEGEEWTQALLGQRHSSLVDEREAYKQVCDGFSQQLQVLHTELDNAERQAENQQDELYRVRSQMEDTRRSTLRLISEIMSSENINSGSNSTRHAKKAYKTDLETIQAQDLGILPAVQVMGDYTRVLEETCKDNGQEIANLQEKLGSKQEVDTSKVNELEDEMKQLKEEFNLQQASLQSQVETLSQKLLQSQKECQDVQKDLASQRMEMTMYQSSTRSKLGAVQSHKKILKKEVIDLRTKMEEKDSELGLYRHRDSSNKLKVEQERQKSKLLERYVDKIESQVKVQHNMMEMMSQAGSVYGGSAYGGSQFGSHPPVSPPMVVRAGAPGIPPSSASKNRHEHQREIVDDDDDDDDEENVPGNHLTRQSRRQRRTVDDDNKSHMSELTEERTQKQFDVAMMLYSNNPQIRAAMGPGSPRVGPPAIIGIAEESAGENSPSGSSVREKRATISSVSRGSQRPPSGGSSVYSSNNNGRNVSRHPKMSNESPSRRRPTSSARRDISNDRLSLDNEDTGSIGSPKKMSIAQKARLEADRQPTPVRVRANQTPVRGNKNSSFNRDSGSVNSQRSGGFLSMFGRRFEEAVDKSVLGVDMGVESDASSSSSNSYGGYESSRYASSAVNTDVDGGSVDYMEEEKKMPDQSSVASTVSKTSTFAKQTEELRDRFLLTPRFFTMCHLFCRM